MVLGIQMLQKVLAQETSEVYNSDCTICTKTGFNEHSISCRPCVSYLRDTEDYGLHHFNHVINETAVQYQSTTDCRDKLDLKTSCGWCVTCDFNLQSKNYTCNNCSHPSYNKKECDSATFYSEPGKDGVKYTANCFRCENWFGSNRELTSLECAPDYEYKWYGEEKKVFYTKVMDKNVQGGVVHVLRADCEKRGWNNKYCKWLANCTKDNSAWGYNCKIVYAEDQVPKTLCQNKEFVTYNRSTKNYEGANCTSCISTRNGTNINEPNITCVPLKNYTFETNFTETKEFLSLKSEEKYFYTDCESEYFTGNLETCNWVALCEKDQLPDPISGLVFSFQCYAYRGSNTTKGNQPKEESSCFKKTTRMFVGPDNVVGEAICEACQVTFGGKVTDRTLVCNPPPEYSYLTENRSITTHYLGFTGDNKRTYLFHADCNADDKADSDEPCTWATWCSADFEKQELNCQIKKSRAGSKMDQPVCTSKEFTTWNWTTSKQNTVNCTVCRDATTREVKDLDCVPMNHKFTREVTTMEIFNITIKDDSGKDINVTRFRTDCKADRSLPWNPLCLWQTDCEVADTTFGFRCNLTVWSVTEELAIFDDEVESSYKLGKNFASTRYSKKQIKTPKTPRNRAEVIKGLASAGESWSAWANASSKLSIQKKASTIQQYN